MWGIPYGTPGRRIPEGGKNGQKPEPKHGESAGNGVDLSDIQGRGVHVRLLRTVGAIETEVFDKKTSEVNPLGLSSGGRLAAK